jgi:hypothetical protein
MIDQLYQTRPGGFFYAWRKPLSDPKNDDAVAKAIWALKHDLDRRHDENVARSQGHDISMQELNEKVDRVLAGFPGGDPDGHRRFHEAVIAKNEARARLYEAVRAELVSKGLWAAIALVAGSIWYFVWNHKP